MLEFAKKKKNILNLPAALRRYVLRKSHRARGNGDTDRRCPFVDPSEEEAARTDKRIRFREVNCPAAVIKVGNSSSRGLFASRPELVVTVLPRARSLGSLLLFGSKLNASFRGELCDRERY